MVRICSIILGRRHRLIESGIDHLYAAPDIEVKSVALANVLAETPLGKGESSEKQNLKKDMTLGHRS